MVRVLFDSNILIDYLKGYPEAAEELAAYDDAAISVITWIEVAVGCTDQVLAALERDLQRSDIGVLHTTDSIMRATARLRTAALRRAPKLRLPDAMIRATAEATNRIVITRDAKGFKDTNVHVPYRIHDGRIIDRVRPLE